MSRRPTSGKTRWARPGPARLAALATCLIWLGSASAPPCGADSRLLSRERYLDRVQGGWLGQAIGVTLGAPYEFRIEFPGPELTYYQTLPDGCPDQDDIYVELVSLVAMERRGWDLSPRALAQEWLRYLRPEVLWVANRIAYECFQRGIWPPASGRPPANKRPDSIDAQIEADIWGLIAPGLPDTARWLAERAASLTNSGTGADGARFVATAYSLAFFERDPRVLVESALGSIDPGSDYARMVRDVLDWHRETPDWREARRRLDDRYGKDYGGISALLNSGAVVIALLYGRGDFERTILIATMAGWDADCNPATAGGIVGVMIGASRIPQRWKEPIHDRYLNHGALPLLPREIAISELAARTATIGAQVIAAQGGRVIPWGDDIAYAIPRQLVRPAAHQDAQR
jgi:ADP-ribosylglycohydrolase